MEVAYSAGRKSRDKEVEGLELDRNKYQKIIVHEAEESAKYYNEIKKYKEIIKTLLFIISSDIYSEVSSDTHIKETFINKVLEQNPDLKP